LTQLMLHTANSWMVLLLFRKLNIDPYLALGAALIYAIHPVHVESVVWVAERKNLLSAFFLLPSLIFYIRFVEAGARKTGLLFTSGILFALSLFSKSIGVVLPVIFILYDLCIAKRGFKLVEKVPFFALSVIMGLLTAYNQNKLGFISPGYHGGSIWATLLFTVRIYGDYLLSLIFPVQLSPYYVFAVTKKLFAWESFLFYMLIPLIAFLGAKKWKTRPLLAFSLGWFIVFLLPVSNIIPVNTLRNDRFMYLPSIMFFVAFLSPFYEQAWFRSSRKFTFVVGGMILILFSTLTMNHLKVYGDSKTFWLHIAKLYPNWTEAQFEAGYRCWSDKNMSCAIEHYERSIQADPQNARALNNLGSILLDQGKFSEAKPFFEKAIKAAPESPNPYRNLAAIARLTGEDTDKIEGWMAKFKEIKINEKRTRHDPFTVKN